MNTPEKEAITQSIESKESDNPMESIKSSGIFDQEYLDNVNIYVFNINDDKTLDREGKTIYSSDFIYGKTTDFVGVNSKADYEKLDPKSADDRHAIAFYFLEKLPTYDEGVAHEIAHNVYDLEYKKHFGEYIEKDGIPAVSDEYSDKMREKFSNILLESYPNLETDKFSFSRQQICEVFTYLYEREYRNRKNVNNETNPKVKKNCQKFMNNPEEKLLKFNHENNRNCTMEDFYSDNHMLSIILAPLIEEKYADFDERLVLFWE